MPNLADYVQRSAALNSSLAKKKLLVNLDAGDAGTEIEQLGKGRQELAAIKIKQHSYASLKDINRTID